VESQAPLIAEVAIAPGIKNPSIFAKQDKIKDPDQTPKEFKDDECPPSYDHHLAHRLFANPPPHAAPSPSPPNSTPNKPTGSHTEPLRHLALASTLKKHKLTDASSQQAIIDNTIKASRCMAWITSSEHGQQSFTNWLQIVVSTALGEKMWNKFDVHSRGIVETHELAEFLLLTVVLYKSTSEMRRQRQMQRERRLKGHTPKVPQLNKAAMREDLEHLAVWIICNKGDQTTEGAFQFILTKQKFKSSFGLQLYVEEYIEEHEHLMRRERAKSLYNLLEPH